MSTGGLAKKRKEKKRLKEATGELELRGSADFFTQTENWSIDPLITYRK